MAISMAPGLDSVVVFEGGDANAILADMAVDSSVKQLSSSWTYGVNGTTDNLFREFQLQGQSFFTASGDWDAIPYPGTSPEPCSDTNITSVGGTTLSTTGPGGSYVSETVWNWDIEKGSAYDGEGSTGGVDTAYSMPSYQQGVANASNQGSATWRNFPDVALTADNIYVRSGGTDHRVGGTSAAAPLWAGFIALANQQRISLGGSSIGFINPVVYSIGEGNSYTSAFHDITAWNNEWSGSPNKYSAVSGYDLCTGWGSPNGANLINALAGPISGTLHSSVTLSGTLTVSGPVTVPSGDTLTIIPSSALNCAAGANLVVNGVLVANGVTFNFVQSYPYSGITINGNGSSLTNCTISGADQPIAINNVSSCTISGCTINNSNFSSYQGVDVNNSTPTITNLTINGQSGSYSGIRYENHSGGTLSSSTIRNCGAGHGIIIQGGSSPTINDCTITGNYFYGIINTANLSAMPTIENDQIYSNGSGRYHNIVFIGSQGFIQGNRLSNGFAGLGAYSDSYVTSGGTLGVAGDNYLHDNSYGMICSDPGTYVALGGYSGIKAFWGTCNQFYGNTTYNAYIVGGASVNAYYDWWGQSPPDTSLFYVGSGSTFNYTPYMTSTSNCPIGGGAAPIVQNQTAGTLSAPSGISPTDSLLAVSGEALDLLDYSTATSACGSVLGSHSASFLQKQVALARLSQIFLNEESRALTTASPDSTILSELHLRMESKDSLSETAEELLAADYTGSKQLGKAQSLLNDLISRYPGTDVEKRSLILLASLRWFDPSYYQASSTALNTLTSEYGSSVDAGLMVALGGSSPASSSVSQEAKVPVNQQKANSTDTTSLAFQLGNYPNPFNPTTVIQYQLPKDTRVNLEIYDILGREVATVVDGQQTAGYHEVEFDGSRFASGVYFYRLATPTYSKVRKMILMK